MRYQEPANTGLGSARTGWVLWDVTTQVQQMYADSNNGFLLRDSAGDEPTRQRQVFSSRTVVMDEPADHVDAHDLVPSRTLVPGQKTDGNRALDPAVRELYLDQRWHGFVGPEHLLSKERGDVWVFGSDLDGGLELLRAGAGLSGRLRDGHPLAILEVAADEDCSVVGVVVVGGPVTWQGWAKQGH